ncbi:facilitated trehalose transporter Tret1-like [Maniola hyperantus]|uniref:facilitated trehalose transporter Tret1-like n=1 Tax=Aphantopus hyperantus TaxID=2795564 RepID=UPI00156875A4|nr:facilitated trehalose transporter Tret1-like [Maniola hyperantus]
MKFHGVFREGSQVNQVICAVLINLPVLAYGASMGWTSPMTLLLQSDHSPKSVPLTDTEVSYMASAPYLVCIVFDLVMAYIGDKVGRKIALLLLSMALAISWIILLCSFETWALIFARALVGVTMAGCFVVCPIYTKEISDDSIRGALGCLVVLFQTTGNLFLYIIGDMLSYRTILWVCLSLPTIHMIVFVFMPDSPSYLVKKGRIEDATKALAWLRCRSISDMKVQEEIDFIKKEQNKDKGPNRFLLKSIFTDKILLKAFQIALVVTLAREVCGAIPVLNFAGEIFTLASKDKVLVLTPNQQAMLLGVVQVVGSILASSVVERCGRKPLLFVTSLVSGLSMCLLGSWFLLRNYEIQAPSWLPLMTLCICIFCDASGLQPISIVLASEIFSYKYRGIVMGVTMAIASVSDFLQLLFFKPLAKAVGIHVSFFFFGLVCLNTAAYVIIVIPETKARCLEDIYKDLKKNKTTEEKEATEIKEEITRF